MKKYLSFVLALLLLLPVGSVFAAEDPQFTDIEGHWAKNYILVGQDIVNGYPDGTFRPENNVTNGEFIAMMNRIFIPEYHPKEGGTPWYQIYFDDAIKAGFLPEDFIKDGDKYITREEVAYLINNYLDMVNLKGEDKTFTDQGDIKYPEEVKRLTQLKSFVRGGRGEPVLNGYPDGSFRPKAEIKRGELVKVLDTYRGAIGWYEPTPVDVDQLKEYPSSLALLTEDYIVSEQQNFYLREDEDEGLLSVRDLIPMKLHKNDLLLVYGQEGEYAKVLTPFFDAPQPVMLVPMNLLDKDPEHIRDEANQVLLKEETPVYKNKGDEKAYDVSAGIGRVIQRSDGWIEQEGFGGLEHAWIKSENVETQKGYDVRDWK